MPRLKSNDRYNTVLTERFSEGDSIISVRSVPSNFPTIVTIDYGSKNESSYLCTGELNGNTLTGLTLIKGVAHSYDKDITTVDCLNWSDFYNQYADVSIYFFAEDVSVESSNNYSLEVSDSQYELLRGTILLFQPAHANTGAVTLAVNDLDPISLVKNGNSPLEGGELISSQTMMAIFDGIHLQLFQGLQGIKGETGEVGASIVEAAFSEDDIVFTKDDATTVTLPDAKIILKGDKGDAGEDGTDGIDGLGVPAGGLTGEVLKKKSDADNDTEWGEGGSSSVVNNDPLGTIYPFTSSTIPEGYLLCDGAAISRTEYSDLFAVIGTTYGVGDGTTTFNIPNIAGKTIVGKSADAEFDTLGEIGGEKTHILTTSEIPNHSHSLRLEYDDASYNHGTMPNAMGGSLPTDKSNAGIQNTRYFPTSGMIATNTAAPPLITSTAPTLITGDSAHNNLQPYITLNYIIKAQVSAGVQGLKGDKGDKGEAGNNGNSFITNETPSGTTNGTNVTFTLAGVPISGTLQLFRDGQLLTQGGDYTLLSSTITFVTAPVSGSILIANYQLTVNTTSNADTVDGYHASSTPTASQIPVFDANGLLALSALGYKIQAGKATISVAGGSADYTVTFPTAWSTEQLFFILTGYPLSSWSGVTIMGCGIASNSLTAGFARINTTSTQNFNIYWISIGK